MLLFRSITVGLLAACVYLLADLPAVHTHTVRTVQASAPAPRFNQVTVVDVARGFDAMNILSLLSLKPGEWITSINDRRIAGAEAVSEIVETVHGGAQYLDLAATATGTESRRILVLLH
jgi:hypothetical protein